MGETNMDEVNDPQELYDLVVRVINMLKERAENIGLYETQVHTWTSKEWPPKKLHYDHDRFDPLAEEWSRREDEE